MSSCFGRLPVASVVSVLLTVCLFEVLGCEGRVSIGTRCAEDSACADGLRCRFGRCRAQCTTANDCTSGSLCIGEPGVCTLVTDTCEASCPDGLVCTGSMCAIPCTPVAGCRGGSVCAETASGSVCIALSSDAGTLDSSEPLDTQDPLDSLEPLDTPDPLDAPDGGPPIDWERPLRLCAGYAHACAIRDGRVYCWGANHSSQLGDSDGSVAIAHDGYCGPWDCSDHPALPVLRDTGASTTTLTDVRAISCGTEHTCALTTGGSVWCWGADTGSGILGHEGTGSHAGVAVTSGASSIEVSRFHACARVGSELQCWGLNGGMTEDGRLGSGGPAASRPRLAVRFEGAYELALGSHFTCRVSSEGVRCVGTNEGDVTGLGRAGADPTGRIVAGLPAGIVDLSAGTVFACAVAAGTAHCWGAQTHQVLADTDVPMCFEPSPFFYCRAAAEEVARGFDVRDEVLVRLSRGQAETMCAITAGGRVLCWGWNELGQAGLDAPPDVGALTEFVTTAPDAPLEAVEEVACGGAFCCARTASDEVWCWGENDLGQLGNGTTDSRDPIVDGGVPDGGTATVSLPHPRAQAVDFSRIVP